MTQPEPIDADDLSPLGSVILEAMLDGHDRGLLFGGDPNVIDPSGDTRSTLPFMPPADLEAQP